MNFEVSGRGRGTGLQRPAVIRGRGPRRPKRERSIGLTLQSLWRQICYQPSGPGPLNHRLLHATDHLACRVIECVACAVLAFHKPLHLRTHAIINERLATAPAFPDGTTPTQPYPLRKWERRLRVCGKIGPPVLPCPLDLPSLPLASPSATPHVLLIARALLPPVTCQRH